MKYIKLYEDVNIIEQQPFYLKNRVLYISDDLANYLHKMYTPDNEHIKNHNYNFFNDVMDTRNNHTFRKSNYAITNIGVRYGMMYQMTIYIRSIRHYIKNEHGEFKYYISGRSGDFEMHQKGMLRKTDQCNRNFIIKLFPEFEKIKHAYKLMKDEHIPFFELNENFKDEYRYILNKVKTIKYNI